MGIRDVKLTARIFDTARADHEVTLQPGMPGPNGGQLLWINCGRNTADLELVDRVLGWDAVAARLEPIGHRPLIRSAEQSVRLRVMGIASDSPSPVTVVLDIVAASNIVVTVHDVPIDGLGLPMDVAEAETTLGAFDEADFVALLLDGLLAGYFRAVERIEREIDELDERALRSENEEAIIAQLVALRRQIAVLRRALNPQREVFYSLERPGLVLGDSDTAAWPLVADRFRQAIESVENARELLVGCFDIVISRTSQRTNDVMRVLTVVSSVLLPAVVVGGVMGMNFKPGFFDDPDNFYLVVGLMVVMAVSILMVARYKRWL